MFHLNIQWRLRKEFGSSNSHVEMLLCLECACVSVCKLLYSCSMITSASKGFWLLVTFSWIKILQACLLGMPLQPFQNSQCVAKLVHGVLPLLSSQLCIRTLAILVAARVRKELQSCTQLFHAAAINFMDMDLISFLAPITRGVGRGCSSTPLWPESST